jgi:hypothetical protein
MSSAEPSGANACASSLAPGMVGRATVAPVAVSMTSRFEPVAMAKRVPSADHTADSSRP